LSLSLYFVERKIRPKPPEKLNSALVPETKLRKITFRIIRVIF
jgi:hypothetical protein